MKKIKAKTAIISSLIIFDELVIFQRIKREQFWLDATATG